jgi:hypothetical protein
VLTAVLGFVFGNVLVLYKSHKARLAAWFPMASISFVLGIVIHVAGWKMNKQTWSPSYLFMMAGAVGYVFMIFYLLLDVLPGYPFLRVAVRVWFLFTSCWVSRFFNIVAAVLVQSHAGIASVCVGGHEHHLHLPLVARGWNHGVA